MNALDQLLRSAEGGLSKREAKKFNRGLQNKVRRAQRRSQHAFNRREK